MQGGFNGKNLMQQINIILMQMKSNFDADEK